VIRRREFIAGVGSVVARPVVALAQQPALPVVAVVHPGSADTSAGYAAAFRKGLGEAGCVEGQTRSSNITGWRGDTMACRR
jgi:hypothetical protein